MTRIGYARVSSTDQDTSIQEQKLKEAGRVAVENLRAE